MTLLTRCAAIAGTVLGSAALLAGVPAPTAAAIPCSDVEVVFARGTSEPPGVGRVGQALANALQARLPGRTVSTYGVSYPATYDFLAATDGANDATARITTLAQQCPSTRVVLGGYSQGAAVVDMLGGLPPLGDRVGLVGSALPTGSVGNVAAVAVFGNPSAKFGRPINTSPVVGGRGIDLCSDGDPICSNGRNPFAHTNYETSVHIETAADFAAGLI